MSTRPRFQPGRDRRDQRLNVRMTRAQRQVIAEAAAATGADEGDFLVEAAVAAAERTLAAVPPPASVEERWEEFDRMLEAPAPGDDRGRTVRDRP